MSIFKNLKEAKTSKENRKYINLLNDFYELLNGIWNLNDKKVDWYVDMENKNVYCWRCFVDNKEIILAAYKGSKEIGVFFHEFNSEIFEQFYIGKYWIDVKNELEHMKTVDNDNIDNDGKCIVDFDSFPGLSVKGKITSLCDSNEIEIDDYSKIYKNNI
jgi:hypothetical protein